MLKHFVFIHKHNNVAHSSVQRLKENVYFSETFQKEEPTGRSRVVVWSGAG
jgi:hypothetical protein